MELQTREKQMFKSMLAQRKMTPSRYFSQEEATGIVVLPAKERMLTTCHPCSPLPQHTPHSSLTEAVILAPLRLALMTEKYLPCFVVMVTSFTVKYNSGQETLPIFFDFSNRKSSSKFGFHYRQFHFEMDLKA